MYLLSCQVNPSARATCITTSCNTAAFNKYYKTTASCALPPCPSNTVNCDCDFVVGPIRLPGGKITSMYVFHNRTSLGSPWIRADDPPLEHRLALLANILS